LGTLNVVVKTPPATVQLGLTGIMFPVREHVTSEEKPEPDTVTDVPPNPDEGARVMY
jgi:hypothetical protein